MTIDDPITAGSATATTPRAFAAPTSAPEGTVPTGVPACMRSVRVAATHPGVFHADDVLAAAILKEAFPGVEIRRLARPADGAETARLYADVDVVFDVGAAYEPLPVSGPVMLDHHQRGRAGQWRDGVELSSAGLVWCSFKHRLGLPEAVEILVEDRLIKPVDAVDNGQELSTLEGWAEARATVEHESAGCGSPALIRLVSELAEGAYRASVQAAPRFSGVSMPSLSALLSSFNPSWRELEERATAWSSEPGPAKEGLFRLRYEEAVAFARRLLELTIESAQAEVEAAEHVSAALIADRPFNLPDVVVFDRYYAGMIGGVLEAEGVKVEAGAAVNAARFIVYPDEQGTWLVQCVPPSDAPADRFKQRTPLPETWAGLRGAKLAEVTGVGDSVFCHPGRWICGAGSKEGALALARLALGR